MSHYVFSGVNFILICFLLLKCLLLCDHVTLCLLGYTVCEAADNLKRLGLLVVSDCMGNRESVKTI